MAKYRVYLDTTISVSMTVEVDDNLDEDAARAQAIEKAFQEGTPSICAQCSGWGRSWSKDEGEYEVSRNPDGTEIQPEKVDN